MAQVTFSYLGSLQTWLVPAGVTSVTVDAWGAQGQGSAPVAGGLGGIASGAIAVTPGETLNIYVGGQNGYNGGGSGGSYGGGGSDVRQGGTALANRKVIGGGGGGGGQAGTSGNNGGTGGGSIGGAGTTSPLGGGGGTQSAGGAVGTPPYGNPGAVGVGGVSYNSNSGGGGGGYYGGAGGGGSSGGGGGSSLIPSGGTTTSGVRSGDGAVRLTYTPAPSAPTGLTPVNGAYVDLAATPTFSWAADPGGPQTAYAFRRKLSPSGSYEWWNATTVAWQGTEVFNTSAALSLTFPAGKWVNGSTYNWSVATQNSYGTGPYAADQTVTAESFPVVTITAPVGIAVSSSVAVTWTLGPTGEVQSMLSVAIYTAAEVAAPGFVFGVGPSESQFLNFASTAQAASLNVSGPGSYVAAVQVVSAGGQRSAWAQQAFNVVYDKPAATVIDAYYDAAAGRVVLLVAGHDNILDEQTASPEATLGSWVASGGAIALNSDVALDGVNSLGFTGNGGASPGVVTGPIAAFEAVDGMKLFVQCSVRPKTVARSAQLTISYYDNGFTFISQQSSAVVAEVLGAWTSISFLTTPIPTGTGIIHLALSYTTVIPAGEVHYSDEFGIAPNEIGGSWSRGGLAGGGHVVINYADASGATGTLRNGALFLNTIGQYVLTYDYEAPLGQARTYTPTLTVGGLTTVGPPVTVTPTTDSWLLKDPLDPGTPVFLAKVMPAEFTAARKRSVGVFQPLGADRPIVINDDTELGIAGTLNVICTSNAERAALKLYLDRFSTLLLQSPFGDNFYIELSADWTEKVQQGQYWTIAVPFVEVDNPSGIWLTIPYNLPLYPALSLSPGSRTYPGAA
jgi:hypothetical protein